MGSIVSVSPFRCRMWAWHYRLDEAVNEETCKAEIQSFSEHGQLVPVLGRRLHLDPEYDIELVYGARRLFVARYLNQPLKVKLVKIADREGIIAMDIENRLRKDISPYERGLSYARWLRCGHFRCQEDIARALRVSASQVSRLLTLASLPTVVIDALGGVQEIRETWGPQLAPIMNDPGQCEALMATARSIASTPDRPRPADALRELLSASWGRKDRPVINEKIVRDEHGAALFRVKHKTDSVTLILPAERVSGRLLDSIQNAITGILA